MTGLVKSTWPGAGRAGTAGRCLWDFWKVMHIDDLVIISTRGGNRDCVVKAISNYFWDDNYPLYLYLSNCKLDGHYHRREVKILPDNPNKLWKRTVVMPGSNLRFSLCQLI